MSNYEELISRLRSGQQEHQLDALKKLVYLSVNDQANFKRFAIRLLEEILTLIPQLFEQEVKLLCLQLLSEIAGSYKQFVPKNQFSFQNIVPCLSDEKVEIRKSSHYMILTFVKKYEQLDPVLQSYQSIGSSSACPWKLTQKILHSFESLIVVEPRCVKYSKDFANVDTFLDFVFKKDICDNALVKKASNQALTSFVKNQYVPEIITNLNKNITSKLIEHSKSINYFPFSDKVAKLVSGAKQDQQQDDCIQQITMNFTPSVLTNPRDPSHDITFSPMRKGSSIEKRKEKLVIPDVPPLSQNKQDPLDFHIQRIHGSQPWNTKRQAVCQIYKYLSTTAVNKVPEVLIQRVLDLTSDLNFTTCINALYIIKLLVNDFFKSLKVFQERLEDILADKICDMKMAIRQEAAKISRQLIMVHNEHRIVRILMQRIKTCSFAGKQQIIKLMQDVYTTSIQTDAGYVVGQLATLLFQDNSGIKSKAMSCIVAISQNSNVEQCKSVLSKKLNKVYFDMFLQKLKDSKNDKGWPTKVQSLQVQNNHGTSHHSQYAMTYTQMRTNPRNTMDGKQGVNTISNFGTFPSSSPDQKLGIIGRRKVQQAQKQKQKQEDKSYQYKPMLARKGKNEPSTIELKRDDDLIIQSKQYRVKQPSQHRKQQQYIKQERKYQVERQRQQPQRQKQQPQRVNSKPFGSKKSSNIAKQDEEELTMTSIMKKTAGGKEPRIPDYKATTYMSKDDIEPLSKPEGCLKKILVDIKKDDNWSLQFESLDSIRKVLKHHKSQYISLVQNLSVIMPEVLKLVESLRSSLAKNAMITLSQMCESLKKQMDVFLQPIFAKLFKKGCDANSFISEQARKCISYLCYYCTPQKIVPIILLNCQSKQIQVRSLVIYTMQKICSRTNLQPLNFLKQNTKIVNILGQYLSDSNNDVRSSTKTLVLSLAVSSSKSEVQTLFKKYINQDSFSKLRTILSKQLVGGMVTGSASKNFDL